MSRITCLIIFSGSSARSIISFRLARIRVLTRSKSPMVSSFRRSLPLPKPTFRCESPFRVDSKRFRSTIPFVAHFSPPRDGETPLPKPGTLERSGDLRPGHVDQDQDGENSKPPEDCPLLIQCDGHDVPPV